MKVIRTLRVSYKKVCSEFSDGYFGTKCSWREEWLRNKYMHTCLFPQTFATSTREKEEWLRNKYMHTCLFPRTFAKSTRVEYFRTWFAKPIQEMNLLTWRNVGYSTAFGIRPLEKRSQLTHKMDIVNTESISLPVMTSEKGECQCLSKWGRSVPFYRCFEYHFKSLSN